MFSLSAQFSQDESRVDGGLASTQPAQLPSLFRPSFSIERGLDVPVSSPRNGVWYQAPRATTPGELENHFVSLHNYGAKVVDMNTPVYQYSVDSCGRPIENFEYLEGSFMPAQSLELPEQDSDVWRPSSSCSVSNCSDASIPETIFSSSSSSLRPGNGSLGVPSSLGLYTDLSVLDLKNSTTFRSFSAFKPSSSSCLGSYSQPPQGDVHKDNILSPSYNTPSIRSRKGNTWGYPSQAPPSALPVMSISPGNRYTHPTASAAAAPYHGSWDAYCPQAALSRPGDDLRRWPHTFDVAHVLTKYTGKKQLLACFFCRARKIGCIRPLADDPDQTCNQCLRRHRHCVYPTESRRGQHMREGSNAKRKASSA